MNFFKLKRITLSAFTMSELLIALAILGLIATFTVPKVLHSIDEANYRTALKEAESLIQSVANQAYTQGYTGNRFDYYRENVNTVKTCTNGVVEGCMVGGGSEFTERAFVLPSNISIGSFSNNPSNRTFDGFNTESWYIDLNGTTAPNVLGRDILEWQAPRFNSSGLILNCNGRQLGCVGGGISMTRYRQLMGI
jgi:prepilin-type N-terminal cleavage/methylation domain-containing protein